MSDDLIDRLQNPHFDDLQWPKGLFAEAADRIETLEAALREVISVSDRKTDIYDRAKAALAGEKKDD